MDRLQAKAQVHGLGFRVQGLGFAGAKKAEAHGNEDAVREPGKYAWVKE
jgi:hypothetical protein